MKKLFTLLTLWPVMLLAQTGKIFVDEDHQTHKVYGLPTPSASNEAATKGYVDAHSSSFTPANLTDAGTDGITITGGTNAVNGTGTSLAQQKSDATHNGYLSNTDWTTFNGKQDTGGAITLNAGTSVGLTAPGAMSIGGTYTIGDTHDNVWLGDLGLGAVSPTGGGQLSMRLGTNGTTAIKIQLLTDSGPTGNFLQFRNAADSTTLYQVDVGGNASGTSWTGRIVPRVTTVTSSATPTFDTDLCDALTITALAVDITSMTTNLSGTPNDFDHLIVRFKDNGSPRAITWGASFVSGQTALPTTTVASKALNVGLQWDAVKSKWVCLAVDQEP